ncbi:hypothetical protein TBLA_0B09530 [Henningerozyma blattae CBS 6284]|uniref:Transcription factor Iwr1 domain-containing protein n=1 Tax=Henningerozyma blattae (strain ATCC 34711 / CBS 6284 / DSM 70876 / NBRC 10599 / NRRL Y-10934 / UCD 77-7) TaxID=1071380 RepID=I2H068_HENB6|nr:hypothetical protein TBLA_0B09530 [Tetrapisispora blattae CBS 6284]CCH59770.1 hypothetical protein TBLA_0B09530 [Tetrapisispora blattae CBS 6284]
MTDISTPAFIRVKRRRNEDSVNTLLVDDENSETDIENERKIKRGRFVFKLTKTVESDAYQSSRENSSTPLLKLSDAQNKQFILEQQKKRRRESDAEEELATLKKNTENSTVQSDSHCKDLPLEISNMVNDYLKLNKQKEEDINGTIEKRKRSKKHFKGSAAKVASLPSLDYVYDIYKLEPVNETTDISSLKGSVGSVRIVKVDTDLIHDEIDNSEAELRSDDEDSNEENYYRNDYPEDEDDDRSILLGSEGEELAATETDKCAKQYELENMYLKEKSKDDNSHKDLNVAYTNSTNEYSKLFRRLEGSDDILETLKNHNHNIVDLDARDADYAEYNEDDYYEEDQWLQDEDTNMENSQDETGREDDETFERHQFFQTDKEDPMAVHRDKIFGRLQKMIDKRS